MEIFEPILDPGMIPPVLVMLSTLLIWWFPKARNLSIGLVLIAFGAGLINGTVEVTGVFALLILPVATYCQYQSFAAWKRWLAHLLFLGLAIPLMIHKFPGFLNYQAWDHVQISSDGMPYSLYFNLDKTLVGFVLVWAFFNQRRRFEFFKSQLAIGALGLIVLLGASLASGYVHFDPKWTPLFFVWAYHNLFFTCISEEAFFRLYIQNHILKSLLSFRALPRVLMTAVVFGVAHAAGGMAYMGLAFIAGIFYGWILERNGRWESAILLHFTVNACHFLLFTYPALA
jgi:membrane protease YdiL (CAAX protease family)